MGKHSRWKQDKKMNFLVGSFLVGVICLAFGDYALAAEINHEMVATQMTGYNLWQSFSRPVGMIILALAVVVVAIATVTNLLGGGKKSHG